MAQHETIIITLIFSIGGLAGYINYLRNFIQNDTTRLSKTRYILSGIGAAILVPLFLNMLSSNLIKNSQEFDKNNYLVFAGFCFIAGYFSDKFIDSIGDKILKEIQQTKDKVNDTDKKLEKTSKEVDDNKEKVKALIDNDSDIADVDQNAITNVHNLKLETEILDDELHEKINRVINAFKDGEYKFRSVSGLAKQLKYPLVIVQVILDNLEKHGAVKKFVNDGKEPVWSLTKIGQIMVNSQN